MRYIRVLVVLYGVGCAAVPFYPGAPSKLTVEPPAAPPSTLVVHTRFDIDQIAAELNRLLPLSGAERDCPAKLKALSCRYRWQREPLSVGLSGGRLMLAAAVEVTIEVGLKALPAKDAPKGAAQDPKHAVIAKVAHAVKQRMTGTIDNLLGTHKARLLFQASALPTIDDNYSLQLGDVDLSVDVTGEGIEVTPIHGFAANLVASDLKLPGIPLRGGLTALWSHLSNTIILPSSEGSCVRLGIDEIDLGPLSSDGDVLSQDIGLTLRPALLIPCPASGALLGGALPPIKHVARMDGTAHLHMPIAAEYGTLSRIASAHFPGSYQTIDGQPGLRILNPAIFAGSDGKLVVSLDLEGVAVKGPFHVPIACGRIYFEGKPRILAGALRIPDLAATEATDKLVADAAFSFELKDAAQRARAVFEDLLTGEMADENKSLAAGKKSGGTCVTGAFAYAHYSEVALGPSYVKLVLEMDADLTVTLPCATP